MASSNSKGTPNLAKHKLVEGDDPNENQSSVQAKKPKVVENRRKSLVRDRRSSRGVGLVFEDETDICSTIPMDIPEENRLQILLHQSFKLALDSAFNELDDPDLAQELKSKVETSFATVSGEMFALEKLKATVTQVNQDAKITTEPNLELKESIDNTKVYIERLKKESDDWDKLKKVSKVKNTSKREYVTTDEEINERISLEERLEKYAKSDEKFDKSQERLFLQLKTIAASANTLKQFEEQAKEDLARQHLQLHIETAGTSDPKELFKYIPM